MRGLKTIQAANFNCVFGKEKRAMLKEFKNIIFPAFSTGKKEYKNSMIKKFFFKEVKIFDSNLGYCLYGKIIKNINLVVKNRLDTKENLIDVDVKVPSAPYSEFIIILKNHRMLFVPSQPGSPTLYDFKNLIKHSIKSIIRNNDIREEKRRLTFELEIFEIPQEILLEQKLSKVKDIEFFKFEIQPQNSKIFDDNYFRELEEARKEIGASKIEQKIIKPTCVERIKKMVLNLKDMAHYSLKVREPGKEWETIKNSTYKKEIEHYFDETKTNDENIKIAVDSVAGQDKRLSEFDKENTLVYNEVIEEVKKLQ